MSTSQIRASNTGYKATGGDDGALKVTTGLAGAPVDALLIGADGKVTFPINNPGAAPVFGVRAWVTFDGTRNVTDTGASTNGQPVKIFASGNVTSVTKISTGYFEITFTVPMPHAGYHWDWSSISLYNGVSFWEDTAVPRTTAKFRISTAGIDVTSVVDPARAGISVIC